MTVGKYIDNRDTLNGLVKKHGHKKARQILTKSGAEQDKARTELIEKIEKSVIESYLKQNKTN